ncbi:MAG: general secretion pathway protein GspB [Proteobacteria bacterium]|nr:general secretion pathway protein GspB [Pseudomonadota bacterium]
MSLILEALKKSEANRRLGQAPDLGTPFTPARRERSPVWAIIAIALALGFGLWWGLGRHGTSQPASTSPVTASAPAATRAASERLPDSPVRSAPAPGPGDPPTGNDAQVRTAAQRNAGVATQHAPGSRLSGSAAVATMRPAPPASAPTATLPAAPEHVAPPAPLARAPKTTDTRGYTPPATVHPDTAPVPAAAALPHNAAPRLDVPAYYELPFATRKALPQLKLSMHVYTADPKQRFVILDGTRMTEGDTTPDNVTLREIRPDGVVLEFQGQRFFFPRDGG